MKRISIPWSEWIKKHKGKPHLQAVVVGSGYGGSVAALDAVDLVAVRRVNVSAAPRTSLE